MNTHDLLEGLCKGGAGIGGAAGLLASTGDPTGWTGWIERVGFPIAVVCGIAWALVRVARWFASRIAEPAAAAHLSLVGTLEATQRQNAAALERIAASEGATLECVKRMEVSASEDRACAAEDRKTTRMSLDRLDVAVDRLVRAAEGTPPGS